MTPGIIAAFAVAVLLLAAPFTTRKLTLGAEGLSWIALIGGIAMAIWGDGMTTADAIAFASLGASGVASFDGSAWKRVSMTIGASVLTVAIGCLISVSEVADGGRHLDAMMGCWAAFAAAYGMLITIVANTRASFEVGMPAIAGLTAAAGAVLATSRGSLDGFGYYLFLKGANGPLFWNMPGVDKLPGGVRMTVALSMPPWVIYTAISASVLLILMVFLPRFLPKKVQAVAFAAATVALIVVAIAPTQASQSGIPDAQRFEDYARQALMKAQADGQLAAQGEFSDTESIGVDHARHGIDVSMFAASAAMALLVLLSLLGRLEDDENQLEGEGYTLDATKAAGFLWLAWLLSGLVHYLFLGTPGMRSPAEWWLTGVAMLATGLLLVAAQMSPSGRGVIASIVAGLLAWTVALNVLFGNFLGLSVSIL